MFRGTNRITQITINMANKPSKTKKSDYTDVIEASNGTLTDISRRLNITYSTVIRYFEAHPDIKELYEKKRLELIDKAEDVGADLLKYEDDENPSQAANIRMRESQYVRGRLGKNRGWTEKTETAVTGQLDGTIDLSVITMCKEYNESSPNRSPDSSGHSNKK